MQSYEKMSVPEAVRTIVTGNQHIYNCLRMGLINYTALANKIKPEVEVLVGLEVNLNTVVVAIKRFADSVEKAESEDSRAEGFRDAKISLTGGIVDVDLEMMDRFDKEVSELLQRLFDYDPSFRLFQSENSIRIFADDLKEIRDLFSYVSKKFDVDLRKGFAKISVKMPIEPDMKLSLISLISDVLYRNGIRLHDAFFGHDEILLVVDEEVAAKAYEILRSLLVGKQST